MSVYQSLNVSYTVKELSSGSIKLLSKFASRCVAASTTSTILAAVLLEATGWEPLEILLEVQFHHVDTSRCRTPLDTRVRRFNVDPFNPVSLQGEESEQDVKSTEWFCLFLKFETRKWRKQTRITFQNKSLPLQVIILIEINRIERLSFINVNY